jgi:hypothetical protein
MFSRKAIAFLERARQNLFEDLAIQGVGQPLFSWRIQTQSNHQPLIVVASRLPQPTLTDIAASCHLK